jgi:uncharacterized protein YqeY
MAVRSPTVQLLIGQLAVHGTRNRAALAPYTRLTPKQQKALMSLLHKIKDDSLQARKAKDSAKAATLTTLYSEAAMVGKNDGNRDTTDDEVVAAVKKFLKNANDAIAILADAADPTRLAAREALQQEVRVYEGYLPQQLDLQQLETAIQAIIAGRALTQADGRGHEGTEGPAWQQLRRYQSERAGEGRPGARRLTACTHD